MNAVDFGSDAQVTGTRSKNANKEGKEHRGFLGVIHDAKIVSFGYGSDEPAKQKTGLSFAIFSPKNKNEGRADFHSLGRADVIAPSADGKSVVAVGGKEITVYDDTVGAQLIAAIDKTAAKGAYTTKDVSTLNGLGFYWVTTDSTLPNGSIKKRKLPTEYAGKFDLDALRAAPAEEDDQPEEARATVDEAGVRATLVAALQQAVAAAPTPLPKIGIVNAVNRAFPTNKAAAALGQKLAMSAEFLNSIAGVRFTGNELVAA